MERAAEAMVNRKPWALPTRRRGEKSPRQCFQVCSFDASSRSLNGCTSEQHIKITAAMHARGDSLKRNGERAVTAGAVHPLAPSPRFGLRR
jgi:hypothetical protein